MPLLSSTLKPHRFPPAIPACRVRKAMSNDKEAVRALHTWKMQEIPCNQKLMKYI